ncbi:hypothetical protein FRB94_013832 [Tulasnella sp. JGI-2019a]|nr:hypothetical protein FRB94_013832 [Tulasnella sp. JGI-2019a]
MANHNSPSLPASKVYAGPDELRLPETKSPGSPIDNSGRGIDTPVETFGESLLNDEEHLKLYNAILQTRTADPSAIRSTEAELQELVTKCKDVLLRLHTIAITPSLDLSTRLGILLYSGIFRPNDSQFLRRLAIIQAKNATPLQWKSKAKTAKEDLPIMHRNMLQLVDEPDAVIAKINEAMATKAVRYDFPARWPSAFTDIANVIQSNFYARLASASPDDATLLRSRRSLSLLNAVSKEITSMKVH